jgi:hypothetical protein
MKIKLTIARLILSCLFIFAFQRISAQEANKTVTLVANGQGTTQDEAKQVALRNAIEQAFGTFISSNTAILNDALVKDEIVSVSNGNIQKYEVISEVLKPDGMWSNTIKATVSVEKLTSFCESKGVNIEYKGGIFAINIKQQVLNEENEIKTVDNLCNVLWEISKKSFDYVIEAGDPVALDNENKNWKVPLKVTVKANDNFKQISTYLMKTLQGISLSKPEAENYLKLNKGLFSIAFASLKTDTLKSKKSYTLRSVEQIFYLRKEASLESLIKFFLSFPASTTNANISNGIEEIDLNSKLKYVKTSSNKTERLVSIADDNFRPVFYDKQYSNSLFDISLNERYKNGDSQLRKLYLGGFRATETALYPGKNGPLVQKLASQVLTRNPYTHDPQIDFVISLAEIDLNKPLIQFSFDDKKTLEELSKVTKYKVSVR